MACYGLGRDRATSHAAYCAMAPGRPTNRWGCLSFLHGSCHVVDPESLALGRGDRNRGRLPFPMIKRTKAPFFPCFLSTGGEKKNGAVAEMVRDAGSPALPWWGLVFPMGSRLECGMF